MSLSYLNIYLNLVAPSTYPPKDFRFCLQVFSFTHIITLLLSLIHQSNTLLHSSSLPLPLPPFSLFSSIFLNYFSPFPSPPKILLHPCYQLPSPLFIHSLHLSHDSLSLPHSLHVLFSSSSQYLPSLISFSILNLINLLHLLSPHFLFKYSGTLFSLIHLYHTLYLVFLILSHLFLHIPLCFFNPLP